MKIKDEKQKHNHKLTELLKICIFAILMIAPLLASVSQMLYVTFNKNAKDSYSGSYTYETYEIVNQYQSNAVENVTDLVEGRIYHFKYDYNTMGNNGRNIKFYMNFNQMYNMKNDGVTSYNGQTITWNNNDIEIYMNYTRVALTFYSVNPNYNAAQLYYNYIEFDFVYKGQDDTTNYSNFYGTNITESQFLGNQSVNIIEHQGTTLDNAFYYGVDQMTKSDLFNWTQNTAIYTGVKAMTDNLQIQTPAIAILIVYWFILSIIYIIIDIVLKCFTTITHMIFRAD